MPECFYKRGSNKKSTCIPTTGYLFVTFDINRTRMTITKLDIYAGVTANFQRRALTKHTSCFCSCLYICSSFCVLTAMTFISIAVSRMIFTFSWLRWWKLESLCRYSPSSFIYLLKGQAFAEDSKRKGEAEIFSWNWALANFLIWNPSCIARNFPSNCLFLSQ